jgi:oligopeptide transport system substrate-binding protein
MAERRRSGPTGSPLVLTLLIVALLVTAAVACSGGGSDGDGNGSDRDGGGGGDPGEDVAAGTFRMGTTAIESLDPADVVLTDQVGMQLADLLFDGLVAPGPTGDAVVAGLAEAWTVDDAGTTWRFQLDPDRRFSDGSRVTAADVAFTLERLAKRGSTSLTGVRLEVLDGYLAFLDGSAPSISGVKIVDEATLELITRVPYQPLPAMLASPAYGIVPKPVVEADPEGFVRDPVGSGPWEIGGRSDGTLRLEPVAARIGGTGDGDTDGVVDVIEVVPYADVVEVYEAHQAGELDWAQVPVRYLEEEASDLGDRLVATPFHAEFFLAFNLSDDALADPRMREAIVRAIDREAIAEEFVTGGIPLDGTVVDGIPGFEADGSPCGDRCIHDPDRARALVSEVHPDGDVPEIQVDFYDGGTEEAITQAVVDDLVAVGIPAVARIRPFEEYRSFVVGEDQQLFGFGWVGVAPDGESYLGPLFSSTSLDNVTGLASQAVDDAIAAARGERDAAARQSAYVAAEAAVMAELPIVPLAQVRTHVVLSERVGEYSQRLDGTFDVAALELT